MLTVKPHQLIAADNMAKLLGQRLNAHRGAVERAKNRCINAREKEEMALANERQVARELEEHKARIEAAEIEALKRLQLSTSYFPKLNSTPNKHRFAKDLAAGSSLGWPNIVARRNKTANLLTNTTNSLRSCSGEQSRMRRRIFTTAGNDQEMKSGECDDGKLLC